MRCDGTAPAGRIGHTVTVADAGTVYLWGGVNESMGQGGRYLDDFYKFDCETKEWTQVWT